MSLSGRWGCHLSVHFHVPAVSAHVIPCWVWTAFVARCHEGRGERLNPEAISTHLEEQARDARVKKSWEGTQRATVKGREFQLRALLWKGVMGPENAIAERELCVRRLWKVCRANDSSRDMVGTAHGERQMRPGQAWGDEKRQKPGNLSLANSWQQGEYLEEVLLQAYLVLNFFQWPAVGPMKDGVVDLSWHVFSSGWTFFCFYFTWSEEVVIVWEIQNWHLDMPSWEEQGHDWIR